MVVVEWLLDYVPAWLLLLLTPQNFLRVNLIFPIFLELIRLSTIDSPFYPMTSQPLLKAWPTSRMSLTIGYRPNDALQLVPGGI